ncbi:hypothetical protein RJ641_020962 [Dillenia turbinata]|uniref:Uncharacterized protein n=1 Tax=Dillenia turbinata TaxID=194707 RepID=A0AAN8UKT1_9MAGN
MEIPSSTRRVTRSQPLAESAKSASKSRQKTEKQQALIDITNDSPIVGLATGSLETPSSMAELRQAPGSSEALLRGQLKALPQKIEEEAELSKLSLENRQFFPKIQGFTNSPVGILAPTPANTPHITADSHSHNTSQIQEFTNFLVQIDANPSPIQEQLVEISEENEVLVDPERVEEYFERAILENLEDGNLLRVYADLIWRRHKDTSRGEVYFDRALKFTRNDCHIFVRKMETWRKSTRTRKLNRKKRENVSGL